MIKINNPIDIYKKRKKTYFSLLEKQTRRINKLSNIRLIIALGGIANIIYLYIINGYYFIYYVALAYIGVFAYVVTIHNKLKHNNKYFHALHEINQNALDRISGKWKEFKDTGLEFLDDSHSFSSDLDIFGQGSLFQYINTTTTYMGREALRKYLTEPCKTKEEIIKRQEAIDELSSQLAWRQRFMAEGSIILDKSDDNQPLYDFFETSHEKYTKPGLIFVARLMPVISIGALLLYFFRLIPYQIPLLIITIEFFIFRLDLKERSRILNLVQKYEDSIKLYRKMLYQIERKKFKSKYLLDLKDRLVDDHNHKAYEQIKELENISDSILNRRNAYFLPINILTLWDYQCMIALEAWKKKSGKLIKTWLEVIGDFEALSSLSNIRYDNPNWAIPEITDKPYYIRARDMGHPLITENRVCNDFKIDGPTRALLITGSNMSGKSTYLRTAGINLVLAYAGAPVCAKEFSCNIFTIYTCMRVSDNLEKNISSFYAELLRIKEIVDESKRNKVFFLLDEIFKGTNSHDRHEGAKILIKKLLDNNAIGLISTHDLELGILERESSGKVRNYHFREYYKNKEIHFDYKLNPGISTTRNSMYLIKMVGIDE